MPEHAKESGADVVHAGVIPELEDLRPDYSIVPEWHRKQKASVFFTHRGCIRSCQFCAVPFLEGKPRQIRQESSIRHLIDPEHTKVILWDNNILGQPNWRDIIEELKQLRLIVDFNQGLDARLITDEVAECMRGLRMPVARIAYDFPGMERSVKQAIERMSAAGFNRRKMVSYVLFNFNDTPEDLFQRVRNLLNWGITAYPMRFQPLNALEKDSYVGPHWTAEQLEMIATARRVIGNGGAFPPYEGLQKKIDQAKNFEEAFGLWHTKADFRASNRRTLHIQMRLFSEMADDHQWPLTDS
jgi:hypothetical protein